MATISSFSTIVTPSSSSNSLTFLPSNHSHFSTNFLTPKPTKPLFKTLFLKAPRNPCQCVSSFSVENVENEVSDELEKNPDDVEGDDIEGESKESELETVEIGENEEKDGRLYVGNLPFSMTTSELSQIFSQAGQIKSVEIIYDKMTDRSRGFGFVTMESIDDAREAIRMFDGSQVGGRSVRVNFPEVPRGGERKMMGAKVRISNQSFVDTPHKIYAGNLGWSVTTQGLRDAFAEQPGFSSAKVVYERDSGRSRGFGFISFSSEEDAQSALTAMNGMELEGRPLRLNVAADKSPPNSGAVAEQSEVASAIDS